MQPCLLEITVLPKSSRSAITVDPSGRVKVYLNSPPAEGRANGECIALFSKALGVAKSRISIDRGARGRRKMVRVDGLSRDEIMALIGGAP